MEYSAANRKALKGVSIKKWKNKKSSIFTIKNKLKITFNGFFRIDTINFNKIFADQKSGSVKSMSTVNAN